MYFGYTGPELMIFGLAAFAILWSLIKILILERHTSKFLYWFVLIATCLSLWLWRSGIAADAYLQVRLWIGTPK
ncbi:MAG: hypothetical protein R6U50_02205 [Desulfobacterales bacterium]